MNPFELVVFFYLLDPQVSVQIEKMGDDKQSIRNAANKELVKMDERAIVQALIAKDNHKDPEIRVRCRRLVAKQINSVELESYPWVDCLPKYFPDREQVIERYYKELNHEDQDNYAADHLRYATQMLVRSLVEKGWKRGEIKKILDDMKANEDQWMNYAGTRNCYPPDFDR